MTSLPILLGRTAAVVLTLMLCAAPQTMAIAAGAAPSVQESHAPVTFLVTNPCTGEDISGSAFVHTLTILTTEPNTHFSGHSNFQDAQGTTQSGVRYVFIQTAAATNTFDFDSAPATWTQEFTFQWIRLGKDGTEVGGDDFYGRLKSHFTINADGTVTVVFFDFTFECR